jgi:hypothetical protein
VLQSGIYISKRFHKNKDTERSSHPKIISSNENADKVWNLVIQTRQDINQAYYTEILKLCETVHKKRPELLSKNLFLHHENAPVNQALSVKSVYGKASINGLENLFIHKIWPPLTFGSLQN